MNRALAIIPVMAILSSAGAAAGERCIVDQYRPPADIAEAMQPYLLCGLLQGRSGHLPMLVNDLNLVVTGPGEGACDSLRRMAVEAASAQLAATMPDPDERLSLVSAEFEKADAFLRVAARSDDLIIGVEPTERTCRMANASGR